jgi:hypothetical protein
MFLNHLVSILTHFLKIQKNSIYFKKSGLISCTHYTLAKIAYCTSTKTYMKLKLGMHRQIVLQIILKNRLLIKFSVLQHLVLEGITLVLDTLTSFVWCPIMEPCTILLCSFCSPLLTFVLCKNIFFGMSYCLPVG